MIGWKKDKKWSDIFLTEIKSILGVHLISEPPFEEDQNHNTDLMVLKMDAVRVGCRIRKHNYLEMYGDEFTIRAGRPSGNKTELSKIIEGWGDYFFYVFANKEETQLEKWTLVDMNCFRLSFANYMATHAGVVMGIEKCNHDKSSSFRIFNMNDFPPNFILSTSHPKKKTI